VLIPEVIEAIEASGSQAPVLAAGGIVTGRQMAAAVAMGAAGAWTGSVWLTTEEAETAPHTVQKMLAATSRDTVRSAGRTGKTARPLTSEWTGAWPPDGGGGEGRAAPRGRGKKAVAAAAAVDVERAGHPPGRHAGVAGPSGRAGAGHL